MLFKLLIYLNILAEWTGLEPATPGVTGRGAKSMLARVCGRFEFQKRTISGHCSPGES